MLLLISFFFPKNHMQFIANLIPFFYLHFHTNVSMASTVVEAAPVQNQAAARKLLQKMSTQNQDSRYSRGRKFRGKERQEESEVFTLEEWEKRKAGAKPSITASSADVRRDEELAWQLQNQFDSEDSHVSVLASLSLLFVIVFIVLMSLCCNFRFKRVLKMWRQRILN